VSDPHPARFANAKTSARFCKNWWSSSTRPDSAEELIETLAEAEDNDVIGADSRVMLERVIRMADMTAGDVMVAAPRMDLINIDAPYDEMLHLIISTAHSRFPVYQGERENIIGILMAKDCSSCSARPS
jgi:magnesium and cobalt transporter